ncbi:MAG: membrane dipeptidase [Deltaproteobacteria bacterium]|nr:membrane dipeptidase [Deltaproteobacteria bacterium]
MSDAASELHRSAIVIDLHADTLIPMRAMGYDIGLRHKNRIPRSPFFFHCDLPRFRDGGATGQFFGLVTNPYPEAGCADATYRQIEILESAAREYEKEMFIATTGDDLRRAKREGKLASFMGIEGAHALEGETKHLARLHARGVRYIGLAHFTANKVAPCVFGIGASATAGLTEHGREVVAEMNRLGILVDLAHVGRAAFFDSVKLAKRPVIVSHTGVVGAFPHWRNLDDEQIRAVAETDGVIGIIFAATFLGKGRHNATLVIDHMEHVRRTVGARHVALGSDFDGFITPCAGLEDVAKLPVITELLLARGWSADEILGMLGGNVLRVLDTLGSVGRIIASE